MPKENQRIMLTKKLLKDSLIGLLKKENINHITIRELCDTAGINRSTFYKYYGSPYDLLMEMENDMLERIKLAMKETLQCEDKDDTSALTSACEFLEQNEEFGRLLLNNNIDPEFPKKLFQLPQIKQTIKEQLHNHYSEEVLDYVSTYIIDGSYNMIRKWLNNEKRVSAKEIATLLVEVAQKSCN